MGVVFTYETITPTSPFYLFNILYCHIIILYYMYYIVIVEDRTFVECK